MARRFPQNIPDDELRVYLKSLDKDLTDTENASSTPLYGEATLASDLNAGSTVSLGGKTYSAKFVRTGFKLESGTLIGGIWNGTNYSIIAASKCEVAQ